MWNAYYQPALQLLQQQAIKRPVLILIVYPYTSYEEIQGFSGNFIITNSTFELRPGQSILFHVFISNAGTSPTVATDLVFQYFVTFVGGESSLDLNATIIKPGDTREWVYPFTVHAGSWLLRRCMAGNIPNRNSC